jgi:chemosensory pili system protein ChpA (sensor histidine kinase/response regulator)
MRDTEAQLQQELRVMFDLDTQKYLQSYALMVQRLSSDTWIQDIQEIYRQIHTIKGGAATVGLDPVLQAATALEDLLSDLRYQDPPPPLEDGQLANILMEAGELLSSSIHASSLEEVAPRVSEITQLRQRIQKTYLQEWDEQVQLYREFADQGFDLVVLDLDIALENLPKEGQVPAATITLAKTVLRQLVQIGKELKFAPHWIEILKRSQGLFIWREADFWRAKFPPLLQALKESARLGGRDPNAPSKKDPPMVPASLASPEKDPEPKPEPTPIPDIPILVSLERLDQSAQQVVETLLSAKAAYNYYQALQTQLTQLVDLAQDNVQYITQLRQLQDDYALLTEQTRRDRSAEEISLERYRQGYTTINRLLETSLRLAELGSEVEKGAQQTGVTLKTLDQQILALRRTVEENRLVPFQDLAFRARAIVRDLSSRLGKSVRLLVTGEALQMDAGTTRQLEAVLLHLLRNALDHGLEPTSERSAHGKPAEGTIHLSLVRQGDLFLLEVTDDGRGIDAQKISQLAQSKGLPLTQTETPEQLLAVLCQPGFSSKSEVTDISGRGIGMDVVAAQVSELGGRLTLKTQLHLGSTFSIQVPVPHLLISCLLVKARRQTFAIPMEDIVTTTLWSLLEAQAIPSSDPFSWKIGGLPGIELTRYWPDGSLETFPLSETSLCVRLRPRLMTTGSNSSPATSEFWILADDIIGVTEAVISQLPSPLIVPPGLLGVSLQPDGSLIPVLDSNTLLLHKDPAELSLPYLSSPVTSGSEPLSPLILVVDDAALVRRRIEASLQAYGYRSHSCSDGLEAWSWLQANRPPALIITDIEMPGMDGFTLIERCRKAGMELPILVISSRLSEEWSREAERLGATGYLTKGFSTPDLLQTIEFFLTKSH